MDFEQAYLTIVQASIDKDTVEVPTILSSLDFKDKKCLEIGCGVLARLAIKVAEEGASQVICLENYDKTMLKAKKAVEDAGRSDKIDIQLNKDKIKLPFQDNSFDIIYGAWLPHDLTTNQEFLDELVRVSKEGILLVMPGIDDDLVKMKSIVYPDEKKRRENYKEKISKYLKNKGLKVNYKEGKLRLNFKNFDDIKGVFDLFDFSKGYEGKEEEVDNFLRSKVHNMTNSFYCLIAKK